MLHHPFIQPTTLKTTKASEMTKRYREEALGVDTMKLANLLVQLARGGGGGDRRSWRSASPGGRVFQCMTCSRQFASFQALGGHRASHKKPRLSVGRDRAEETTALKPKVHECSICGLRFGMGQALGGHMRRHRHGFAGERRSSNGRRVLLDLNLPPLEEEGEGEGEGESRMLGLSLGLGLGLVC